MPHKTPIKKLKPQLKFFVRCVSHETSQAAEKLKRPLFWPSNTWPTTILLERTFFKKELILRSMRFSSSQCSLVVLYCWTFKPLLILSFQLLAGRNEKSIWPIWTPRTWITTLTFPLDEPSTLWHQSLTGKSMVGFTPRKRKSLVVVNEVLWYGY